MAGNVAVELRGTSLFITGDSHSSGNQVQLTETVQQGRYTVQGLSGTLINGASSRTFSGVTQDIQATFRNGPDLLRITGAFRSTAMRDVIANMGAGNDTFEFVNEAARNVTVNQTRVVGFTDNDTIRVRAGGINYSGFLEGNLTLNNEVGNDVIEVAVEMQKDLISQRTDGSQNLVVLGSDIGGHVKIYNRAPATSASTGSYTEFNDSDGIDVVVGKSITLESTGPGTHTVLTDELQVGGGFSNRSGATSDIRNTLGDTTIGAGVSVTGSRLVHLDIDETYVYGGVTATSTRDAIVYFNEAIIGAAVRVTANGALTSEIEQTLVTGGITLRGGSSRLNVSLEQVQIGGFLTIQGGAVADRVVMDEVVVHQATIVELGAGNDNLHVQTSDVFTAGSRFLGDVRIIGGTGRDTIEITPSDLTDGSVTIFGSLTIDFNPVADAEDTVSIGSIRLIGRRRIV